MTARSVGELAYSPASRRVKDLPCRLRPREELDRVGAENVSDIVLLSVLLRGGVRGLSVVDLAEELLREYGSLDALAKASIEELAARRGMGRVKAQVLKAALELAQCLAEEHGPARQPVKGPHDAAKVLRQRARTREEEAFWVLMLDAKNRLIRAPLEISRGLLDASLVHPREVFREAIRSSSAAVILVHNHPSGDPTPSAEDIRVTKQLVEAGRIVDIQVLDHVILGRRHTDGTDDFISLCEAGVVDFSNRERR